MLDALGFRGIWRRHSPETVIAKLMDLQATTATEASRIQEVATSDQSNFLEFVQPMFFSDNIVFGVTTKSAEIVNAAGRVAGNMMQILAINFTDIELQVEAIKIAAELTAVLIRRAVSTSPALAFRGCLSFGDFGMTDRFLIGEAVDEAASLANLPHGALVMLAPSGDQLFPRGQIPWKLSPLVRYRVPMKRGGPYETQCIAPFNGNDETSMLGALLDQFDATFIAARMDLRKDVAEKKANTKDFLTAAWKAKQQPWDELHRALSTP